MLLLRRRSHLLVGLVRDLPQHLPALLLEFLAGGRTLLLLLLLLLLRPSGQLFHARQVRHTLLDEELGVVLGAGVALVAEVLENEMP